MNGDFSFLAYSGAWATIILGVWFLFEKAEETVSPEVRDAASRWLQGLDPAAAARSWPGTFAAAFDRVFGERHFSWRCFRRSCAGSLAAVAIILVLWAALHPEQATAWTRQGTGAVGFAVGATLFITVALNFVPDYVSLWETRSVIEAMSRTGRVGPLLLLDVIATMLLALIPPVAIFLLVLFGAGSEASDAQDMQGIADMVLSLVTLSGVEGLGAHAMTSGAGADEPGWSASLPAGIWFYSAFLTSIWVWLYAAGGVAARAARATGRGLEVVRLVLDVEEKPLRSIGFAASLLVTLGFLLGLPFAAGWA